jgi:hypothetical protein
MTELQALAQQQGLELDCSGAAQLQASLQRLREVGEAGGGSCRVSFPVTLGPLWYRGVSKCLHATLPPFLPLGHRCVGTAPVRGLY